MEYLLDGLTDAQREAVCHKEGPLLMLAGPGSGKTRVVTHRIAWLLNNGVPGHQILALTFTNKAAEEMRARVDQLVPNTRVWVGTYHRFGARLLRRYASLVGLAENYTIYDTADSKRALQTAIGRRRIDLAHFAPDQLRSAISWAKNNLITPSEYTARPGHPLGAIVKQVYPAYQALLSEANAADFDDLLLQVAILLRDNPEIRASLDSQYRYILVDEYQDTNLAQYAIARALSVDYPNLAVTGDPDQSIYGWRGANIKNILEFERDFPDVCVVRLERNYRSSKRILAVASALIVHNVRRKEKELFTENDEGAPVRLTTYSSHKEEAQSIARRIADEIASGRRRASDYAIFYRINALSRAFELALREHGVPFQLVRGLEFFQRREIKDIRAYLQLLNNPSDDITLLRIINTPTRGIGKTTIERLSDHAMRGGLTLLESARDAAAVEKLSKRAAGLVTKFVRMFDSMAALVGSPLEELLGHVLTESGYQKQLEASDAEEDEQKLANIQELLTVAREFDERHDGGNRLEAFLEETALAGDTDEWESETDRATLMTLHASKGLEFPVVFLVATEEGLLPHERSRDSKDQLEEERRLMFVGITRAQEELEISKARYRDFRGQRKMTIPSQFLMELPRAEMEVVDLDDSMPVWSDSEYQRPAPSPRTPRRKPPTTSLPLTTGAELAGQAQTDVPAVDPDSFRQGMVVRHPEHGLGKVVALSGNGPNRKATIDFALSPGRKKFVIAASPLRPLKK